MDARARVGSRHLLRRAARGARQRYIVITTPVTVARSARAAEA